VGERSGGARYALLSNVNLARALRFRARRWESTRFNMADGLVLSPEAAKRLTEPDGLSARAYSASSLALFAGCPYRFFLHAIMGIAEREEVIELDALDPRQQGVVFHAVQRELLKRLAERGMLPLLPERAAEAQAILAQVFEAEVQQAREDYAPAVQRVFDAALSALRGDLEEWLRRLAEERNWVPAYFELGFGLRGADERAAESTTDPVALGQGLSLRGAIDLVERRATPAADGRAVLRATDHKTGMPEERSGAITAGGRELQPLLYALALEKLFPEALVDSGRLYFCTVKAGYLTQEVPLNDAARARARELIQAVDGMIRQGFLPAAPASVRGGDKTECERCSYRAVCGPYEAERVARVKAPDFAKLAPLSHVRNLP
jgi:ATP-dependent helicase/nuclease subunit B